MNWLDHTPRPLRPGGLVVRFVGGHDWVDDCLDDSPVVVLLHASGARPDDLVPLSEMLAVPDETRFALPEALLPLPGMWVQHRAWWPLELDDHQALLAGPRAAMMDRDPPGLDAACDAVDALLDALPTVVGVPLERVVLGGFSRGAVVATQVALRGRRPLAGLLLLSTTIVRAGIWRAQMRGRTPLPILLAHGRADPFHPPDLAAVLRDDLAAAGHAVDWVEHDAGHAVPPIALARSSIFLRRALERSP